MTKDSDRQPCKRQGRISGRANFWNLDPPSVLFSLFAAAPYLNGNIQVPRNLSRQGQLERLFLLLRHSQIVFGEELGKHQLQDSNGEEAPWTCLCAQPPSLVPRNQPQ